jgi:hypothetical protein
MAATKPRTESFPSLAATGVDGLPLGPNTGWLRWSLELRRSASSSVGARHRARSQSSPVRPARRDRMDAALGTSGAT